MAKQVKVFKGNEEIPDDAKWLKTETEETGWGEWTTFHWYEVPIPRNNETSDDSNLPL